MTGNWQRNTKILELVDLNAPALIINAPAGCGKTALAAQYASAVSASQVWVTLDGRDRDPSHLSHHLIQALDATGRNTKKLDRWKASVENYDNFAAVFAESIGQSTSLFLDDFHKIAGSEKSIDNVSAVVSGCAKRSAPVVLTSRNTSGLKFADLALRGIAVEIGFDDIGFSADEISALYRESFGLVISSEQGIRIHDVTSGWAICVVFLGRLLARRESAAWDATISSMRGNPLVSDYLAQEVLDRLEPGMRRKLYLCSLPLLGDSTPLIDAGLLCEGELGELHQTGIFTSSYDARGRVSQVLHPIVRRHLRIGIGEVMDADELAKTHLHIASSFKASKELVSALHHYEKAGTWEHYREALADLYASLKRSGEYVTYIHWANRLPSESANWQSYYAQADAQYHNNAISESLELITTATQAADTIGDTAGSKLTRMKHAKILQWMDVHGEQIDRLMDTIDQLPEDLDFRSKVEAGLVKANGYCCTSKFYETARTIRSLRSLTRNSPDHFSNARLDSFDSYFQLHLGRSDKMKRLMIGTMAVFQSQDQANYGQGLNALATAAVEMDETAQELLRLVDCLVEFVTAGAGVRIDALGTCAQILLSLGKPDEAFTKLQEMQDEKGVQGPDSRYVGVYLYFIRYYRTSGNLCDMQRYLKLTTSVHQTEQIAMLTNIESALARIVMGERQRGLAELDKLEQKAAKQRCRVSLAHIWYAKGRLALEDGEIDKARPYLTKALHQSNRGKRSYWLRVEAQGDPAALVFAFREGIYSQFVEKILIRAGATAARAIAESVNSWPTDAKLRGLRVLGEIGDKTTVAAVRRELRSCDAEVKAVAREVMAIMAPPETTVGEFILTSRELEILELISRGATNSDISKTMFIEGTTVKTHVNRIFRKLGVSQRVQAAVYYRENFLEQTGSAAELK